MLILGVDPGTQILGYSLLRTDDGMKVEAMDVLYLKKEPDYNQRIKTIFDSMHRLMEQHHPDVLAIEAPFFGKNVQSMLKLGRAQGVTIAAALSLGIPFTEYEPATIKQYITGNGAASKEQVLSMLESQLGMHLEPQYLDASDALAAALCHHLASSNPLGELRKQLKPARTRKTSTRSSWSQFVQDNPNRLDEDR